MHHWGLLFDKLLKEVEAPLTQHVFYANAQPALDQHMVNLVGQYASSAIKPGDKPAPGARLNL
jgi:hypothetical protein